MELVPCRSTQPHGPQTACQQVHEETADTTTTHCECAEPIVPVDGSRNPPDMPPKDGARHQAGEGVNEDRRTGAGDDNRVDHTKLATNAATNAMNTIPASMHTLAAPRCDANVGTRDGVQAQQCGVQRWHAGKGT